MLQSDSQNYLLANERVFSGDLKRPQEFEESMCLTKTGGLIVTYYGSVGEDVR